MDETSSTPMILADAAFFATKTTAQSGVHVGGKLIFDNVVSNIGEAYNISSGVFICPISGVYLFGFVTVRGYNLPVSELAIVKEGQVCYLDFSAVKISPALSFNSR